MSGDLKALLARYPALARPLSAPEPLGNAGGLSGARLWRFTSGRGTLVARAWPHDGPRLEAIREIHQALSKARGLGFVAIPVPALDGETVQQVGGRPWDVSPWMPGAADLGRPPAMARLCSGFAGLAAFHQALSGSRTRAPSPGLTARLREIEGLLGGGFDALGGALGRAGDDPRRELAGRWLDLARRLAPGQVEPLRRAASPELALQYCLRDARPDHFLFEGDRLTGLVDFGAMGPETVAADLARLLAEWVGPDRPSRSEALAAYAAVRPLDEAETALLEAFEASAALLGGGRWVRWHFVEGRTFDDPSAVLRGLRRGVERLARLAGARP